MGRAQRDAEIAIATGWWATRLGMERRLSPLSTYLESDSSEDVDPAESLRSWAQGVDARFKRT